MICQPKTGEAERQVNKVVVGHAAHPEAVGYASIVRLVGARVSSTAGISSQGCMLAALASQLLPNFLFTCA